MEIHFRGKTVVITGAAGGLGSAMAERFAKQGAGVVLCDYSECVTEKAEALRKQGLSAVGIAFDVTDRKKQCKKSKIGLALLTFW